MGENSHRFHEHSHLKAAGERESGELQAAGRDELRPRRVRAGDAELRAFAGRQLVVRAQLADALYDAAQELHLLIQLGISPCGDRLRVGCHHQRRGGSFRRILGGCTGEALPKLLSHKGHEGMQQSAWEHRLSMMHRQPCPYQYEAYLKSESPAGAQVGSDAGEGKASGGGRHKLAYVTVHSRLRCMVA